ncbi:hypothetical protein C3941_17035 [Kaistia algarum]|uniref:hypothetical protein n=1 Tax=Kaistia algarum TaxID=2083279 RepID=UPI000CE7DEEE|nr:hypothetical protein [Kaistia algarum]MCX5516331.1 hypothetical protein [Kaistia algarum]PPE78749.1 hypothetical protein C3941_17035 [Kaistia algarum]
MTDYYAVLKKAISGLEHESGEVRRSVYDKARTALIGQLKSIQPPLTTSEISRQRLELEEAIRKVEREAAITAAGPVPARARAAAAVVDARPVDVEPIDEEFEPEEPAPEEYAAEPEYEVEEEPAPPPPPPPPPRPAPRATPRPIQQQAPVPRQAPPPRTLPDANIPIHVEAIEDSYDEPEAPIEVPAARQSWTQPVAPAPASRPAQAPSGKASPFRQEPRIEPSQPQASRAAPWVPQVEPADAPRGRQPAQRREPPQFQAEPNFGPDPIFEPLADEYPAVDSSAEWQEPFEDAPTLDHDFADEARDRGRRPAPRRKREADDLGGGGYGEKPRRSRWPALILLVVIGLILGGIAALAWSQRTIVKDVIGDLISTNDSSSTKSAPAVPAASTDSSANSKNGDRLGGAAPEEAPRAVRTVDAAPAPDDAMSAMTAPDQPAAPPAADAPATAATDAPLPGVEPIAPAAAPAAEDASGSDQALVAQKAILYEQPSGANATVTALNGSVVWKFDANSSNGPEIQALIDVPDRKMKVTVNIRKNTDSTLPASHLVEVIVDTSADFPGGGIKAVPAFVMKPTEEARGQPLDGAPAKVADGFFWIAFSSDAAPMAQNIALLRERNWIDIPLIYENDQRAILTLEKGTPGQKAFEQAFAAWGN